MYYVFSFFVLLILSSTVFIIPESKEVDLHVELLLQSNIRPYKRASYIFIRLQFHLLPKEGRRELASSLYVLLGIRILFPLLRVLLLELLDYLSTNPNWIG